MNLSGPKVEDHLRIDREWLFGLELLDAKIYPLPGATRKRVGKADSRLSKLTPKENDTVCFYEHIASLRHKPSGEIFVAFRQTMDALLLEQQDLVLYPEWLMKDPRKFGELSIHIYKVVRDWRRIPILRSHEDWLQEIQDSVVFNSLAYFLLNIGIVTINMFRSTE